MGKASGGMQTLDRIALVAAPGPSPMNSTGQYSVVVHQFSCPDIPIVYFSIRPRCGYLISELWERREVNNGRPAADPEACSSTRLKTT